jgi:multiple sugar transport system permease protein
MARSLPIGSRRRPAHAEQTPALFHPGPFARVALIALVALVTLFFAFPFIWAVITSVKPATETYNSSVLPWLQFHPTMQNWQDELSTRSQQLSLGLKNSLIAAGGSAAIDVILGCFAGYGLARGYSEKRSRSISSWFISQRLLLPVVVVIPYLMMMRTLGLVDNVVALILAYSSFNLPLAVLVLTDFFRDLPTELEEAALTDGASAFGAFRMVALPLVAPGIVATFILVMAFSWNEFLFALALTYESAVTLPVVIMGAETTRGIEFWYIAVRSLVAMLPPVVLVLFVQRYIVRGLTMGAIKG